MHAGATSRDQRRSGVLAGLIVTLVVAVPTLVVAEDWHGHPLIDQSGLGWVVPTVIAGFAFAAGGAVAGRRRPRLGSALAAGLAVGVVAAVLLLAADILRRLLMNPTLPQGVVNYWIEAVIGSTALAVVGAGIGYRFRPAAPERTDHRLLGRGT